MASSKQIHFGNALYKVPDLRAAKQFYSKAFGVETYFDEPGWIVFEVGGFQLWLVPANSTEEHPEVYGNADKADHELTYWKVKDIDTVYQRFIELGGTVRKQIRGNSTDFMEAIMEDPWENKIGLCQGPFIEW